jgi:hypothetical protein
MSSDRAAGAAIVSTAIDIALYPVLELVGARLGLADVVRTPAAGAIGVAVAALAHRAGDTTREHAAIHVRLLAVALLVFAASPFVRGARVVCCVDVKVGE